MSYSNSNQNELENGASLLFTNRFKSFPVVNSTCFWLSKSYNKIKERNFVTKCTCDLAETTIKNSIDMAIPLMNKFRDQVQTLDSIACNQLDKLEAAFPIIKSDTDTLVNQSKELLNKTVQPALAVKHLYGESLKYCNLANQSKVFVNKLLDLSQSFIETHMIYEKLAIQNKNQRLIQYDSTMSLADRTKMLSNVVYNSVQAKLLGQLNESLILLRNYFANLFKLIESYELLKQSLMYKLQDKFHVTKDKIDLYKEYLDVLSKQFTVQDGRSLHNVHSLEERTKIIIRRSIGNILTAFYIIYSKVNHIVPVFQSRFQSLKDYVFELHQIYNKNEDLSDLVLKESKECLLRIQNLINNFLDNLNNSPVVLWLVPNFAAFGVIEFNGSQYEFEQETNMNNNHHLHNHHLDNNLINLNNNSNGFKSIDDEAEGEYTTNGCSLLTANASSSISTLSNKSFDNSCSELCSFES